MIPVEGSDSKVVALVGRKICIVDRETGKWGHVILIIGHVILIVGSCDTYSGGHVILIVGVM